MSYGKGGYILKFKKIAAAFMSAVMICGASAGSGSPAAVRAAETYEIVFDGDYYYGVYEDHVMAGVYESNDTEIVIPDTFEGLPVTELFDNAFSHCYKAEKITIPKTITSIGHDAFKKCIFIKSLELPDGLLTVGENAFKGCTGLTSLTIPDTVTVIGNGAFSGCTGLTSLTIPDSVLSIGEIAFGGCTGLKEIKLSASLTRINKYTFYHCDSLTSVTIPDKVTLIGEAAFQCCPKLKRIDIPDSVTEICDNAFWWCESLEEINLPGSLTSVGKNLFSFDSSLRSVTFPKSLNYIPDNVCLDCSSLESVYILNPKCRICDSEELFISYSLEDEDKKPVIYGYSGSTAEEYANKYNFRFSALDQTDTTTVTATSEGISGKKGDANCDGLIDMSDAIIIMQSIANPNKYGVGGSDSAALTKQGADNGDVDTASPGITTRDALRIQEYLLGKTDSL